MEKQNTAKLNLCDRNTRERLYIEYSQNLLSDVCDYFNYNPDDSKDLQKLLYDFAAVGQKIEMIADYLHRASELNNEIKHSLSESTDK